MIFTSNSYNGGIWLPKDVATLFQDSAGTTPVTAVTNPSGLVLDQHLGLALGPELAPASTSTTGWTPTNATLAIVNGEIELTATAIGVCYADYNLTGSTINKWYKLLFTARRGQALGGVYAALATGTPTYTGPFTEETNTQHQIIRLSAATPEILRIRFDSTAIGQKAYFTEFSVKLLDGNHLTQSTSAARPTWEVDANGKYCLRFLGTDDNYTCATGGGGSAGGYWCFALKPTGGAGTSRQIFDDRGTNTGYVVWLNTSNKLEFWAGNGAAYTAKASTASIDVGTLYRLTCLDDGTNLSVKINNAAAETIARPVVSAGSSGFTVGKSNLAAAGYLIADIYAGIYVRNACPSAADRAVFEALVDACAGV